MEQEVTSLEELLDRIAGAESDDDRVSLDSILETVGRRSFGPLLLVAGLITVMPIIGDIPGMPTMMGLIVISTAGQMIFGRERFWLPGWILKRSFNRDKLCKALRWLRRPARFLDRITRPRLTVLVHGPGVYAIAIVCIIVALATPAMEFIPFSANGAGAALIAFGLSLIVHDGLVALIAFVITATAFGLVLSHLV